MELTVTNHRARITSSTRREIEWAREYLTFPSKEWNGMGYTTIDVPVIDFANEFGGGLVPMFLEAAETEGLSVSIVDARVKPDVEIPADATNTVTDALDRPYQQEGLQAVLNHRRGIIKWPTGAGKGRIAACIPSIFGGKWLLCVNSMSLADDTATRHEELFGDPVGRIGDGQWKEERFTCATFQTLARKGSKARKFLKSMDGLLIDECHYQATKSLMAVSDGCENAYWRYGLSGTPLDRADQRSVQVLAHLGPIISLADRAELEDHGWLVPARIRMVEYAMPLWRGRKDHARAWGVRYRHQIVKNDERNDLLADLVELAPKPALVFTEHIPHARTMFNLCQIDNTATELVTHHTPRNKRRELIRRVQEGDVEVLVSTPVFMTGVDIPALRAIVVCGAQKATIPVVQKIGRGTRPYPNKTEFIVHDIRDLDQDARGRTANPPGTFNRQSAARIKAYRRDGHRIIETGPRRGPWKPL